MTAEVARDVGGRETLRATDIQRFFEGVRALSSVSFHLKRHEIVGLIGPNGAGKTTLVNIVTGFDTPTSGTVHLGTDDITGWSPERRGKAGLARTFQAAHSFSRLSVRENIEVSALGTGATVATARERATDLMRSLGLARYQWAEAGVLSQGEERKLGVARALASDPRFILMDEPAAGLNEGEIPELAELLRNVRDEHNVGVLLIDHNVPLIMEISDRIQVLDEGKTIATGTPEEIRHSVDVAAAYLGSGGGG